MDMSVYKHFTATKRNGEKVPLSTYAGKVSHIVNTSSKCRFIYQFEQLQLFYEMFTDNKLLIQRADVVLPISLNNCKCCIKRIKMIILKFSAFLVTNLTNKNRAQATKLLNFAKSITVSRFPSLTRSLSMEKMKNRCFTF